MIHSPYYSNNILSIYSNSIVMVSGDTFDSSEKVWCMKQWGVTAILSKMYV